MTEYPDVRIDWIRHRTPSLAVFEDGVKVQTIDLSSYNFDALHTLFSGHFVRRQAGRALDESPAVPGSASVNSSGGGSARAAAVDAASSSSSSPTPVRSNDAALPQPALSGWQAADASIATGVSQLPPRYFPVLLASPVLLVVAVWWRCRAPRQIHSAKPQSMAV